MANKRMVIPGALMIAVIVVIFVIKRQSGIPLPVSGDALNMVHVSRLDDPGIQGEICDPQGRDFAIKVLKTARSKGEGQVERCYVMNLDLASGNDYAPIFFPEITGDEDEVLVEYEGRLYAMSGEVCRQLFERAGMRVRKSRRVPLELP